MSDAPIITEAPPPEPRPPATSEPHPFAVRVWCGFVLFLCAGMLGVGLYLTPSPTGTDTHTQLGLPRCEFYARTGIPCPTCGCTTAVSNFSHGHWVTSAMTQPFGFSLACLAFVLLPLTGVGLATGRWYGPSMFKVSWYWRRWVYTAMAIFVLGWVYKILLVVAARH